MRTNLGHNCHTDSGVFDKFSICILLSVVQRWDHSISGDYEKLLSANACDAHSKCFGDIGNKSVGWYGGGVVSTPTQVSLSVHELYT